VTASLSKEDTLKIEKAYLGEYNVDSLYNVATLMQKQKVISTAVSRAESAGSDWSFKSFNISQTESSLRRHMTSWHEKLTLSLACLIFFFIGAPLGGIIRKGGLGMPVVVSVLIFIIYYIINNTGYKMARDGQWVVWMGMWTSTAVLAPLGAFLTYKSNNDSVVLNADAYINWFKKIAGIRSVRHLFRKEVIIHDPDYARLPGELQQLSADCRAYAEKKSLMRAPNYFSLWMNYTPHDEEVVALNERMEALIDEMSNTRSIPLLTALNNYPIIAVHAHVRPFRNYWLNMLCGVIVPVGLFFYFRIWAFRIRLNKDMERIIKTNEDIQKIIETNGSDPEWYNYGETESTRKWANAKTSDGSMWVWIPRYAYSITSGYHSSSTGNIEVEFMKGLTNETSTGRTSFDNVSGQGKWNIHPAFNYGQIVSGLWVAKFEASNRGRNNG